MEDPSEECEIEEESYYYEQSPQVDYSTGKVSWILNKGWGIGKKLLMTGAVISSAPFVLPPLVVTSAIAFTCWVPCGVVMASYTCSEKIMSKLLPYESEDEEEFEDAEEDVKVDFGEYFDMEEKPLWEGINGARMEGSRCEYNDDVLLDENAISDGVDLVVFNVIEDGEEFGVSPIEVTSVRLEGREGQEKESDLLEEEELVKETRGLLEKIRDEGSADDGMEMENHYSDGTPGSRKIFMDLLLDNNAVSDGVDIYVSNVIEGEEEIFEEPVEKEIVNDFMEDEEVVKETRGVLEKLRDAGSADSDAVAATEPYAGVIEQGEGETNEITGCNFEETDRAVDKTLTDADVGLGIPASTVEGELPIGSEKSEEKTHVTDVNAVSKDRGNISESKNADNNFEVKGSTGETMIVNNILEAENSNSEMGFDIRVVSTVVEETHTPPTKKEEVLQAERAENNIRVKKNVVFTDADVREIADESGLYLFDENNASGHAGGEGADFAELSIPRRISESADAKISSRKDNIHSNGVLKNEDKIWKQIEAIRNIFGYKVARHASYMEELKALYIFTGVEPPTSFNDPTDVAQVDNKLRFLMSIIGLK